MATDRQDIEATGFHRLALDAVPFCSRTRAYTLSHRSVSALKREMVFINCGIPRVVFEKSVIFFLGASFNSPHFGSCLS